MTGFPRQVVMLLLAACAATSAFAAGIDVRENSRFTTRDGNVVRVATFRFSTSDVRMQVLPTLGLSPQGPYQTGGLSIENAAELAALGKLSSGDMLITNGGFSGAKTERALGLVISGGNAISLPDYAMQRGDPDSACPALREDRPRRSGVLCVNKRRQILVKHLDAVDFESCTDAVQAGPLLVEAPLRNGICEGSSGDRGYLRTAVCTRGAEIELIVSLDPVPLFDLAQWLSAPQNKGGLACDAALNLSGDSSSGALLRKGNSRAPWRKFGDGSFPLPNLLVITTRSQRSSARQAKPARLLVPQQTQQMVPRSN